LFNGISKLSLAAEQSQREKMRIGTQHLSCRERPIGLLVFQVLMLLCILRGVLTLFQNGQTQKFPGSIGRSTSKARELLPGKLPLREFVTSFL